MANTRNAAVHRFAGFTAGCTLVVLMAGALVTSNDAGLAVPDWPLSYGSLAPPMVGGIFYEHSHRLIASFVGILSIILAIWLWRVEPRRWVRRLGWTALGLVIAQGVLGGITVLFYLPPWISSAHATLAQLFFVTVLSLTFFTSAWWQSNPAQIDDSGSPRLTSLTVWTSIALLVQLVLGAAFRHNAFGIRPHLAGAAVVTFLIVWTGHAVRKRFSKVDELRKWGIWLYSLLGIQLLLGGLAYWVSFHAPSAPQPVPSFVVVTVAHVLVGALSLGASVLLMLTAYRLIRPAGVLALHSHPEGAAMLRRT